MNTPDYRYTGTVNIWTMNGIVNSGVLQAWKELQAVPSYVERFQRIVNMTDEELATRLTQLDQECPDLVEERDDRRMFRGEQCDSCNRTYCTCNE